jgi:hypothetical protein
MHANEAGSRSYVTHTIPKGSKMQLSTILQAAERYLLPVVEA